MNNWEIHQREEDGVMITVLHHRVRGDVMTDCELEMDDMKPFLESNPSGNIAVGGLGLGLIIDKLLVMDGVENIYVVEEQQEVIDLTSPKYTSEDRVTIVKGDARTFDLSKIPYEIDVVYMDIWDNDLGDTFEDRLEVCKHWGNTCKDCFSWALDRSRENYKKSSI